MLNALLLSLVPLLAGDPKDSDLVVLANGKEIDCRVVYEDDQEVVYRVKSKETRTPRAEVKEVHSVERSLAEFLKKHEQVGSTDLAGLAGLAIFAEENDLPGEARNLWIRIVALDPENEQAWTKLGGSKGKKGWRFQVRGRYLDLEALRSRVSDWKNALELSTAHFQLRTDGDPLRALDVSVDLERAYMAFYELIGKPLKLYVFDEEPEIRAYSDAKDYPAPPVAGQTVWFSPGENILHVNSSAKPLVSEVVGELSQCLIFNSFRRSADAKTGNLEPWLTQGLMRIFASAVRPDPGRVSFEFDSPNQKWFEAQARDKKPIELSRVLVAGRGSFDTGDDAERTGIAAYTFLYFLAFHEHGKYRPKLAPYVRESFLGKGGKSQFLEAMGVKEEVLETEWRAFVQRLGGL